MLLIPPSYAQVLHSISLLGDPERLAVTYGIKFREATPPSVATVAQDLHLGFHNNWKARFGFQYAVEETAVRYASGETANPDAVEVYVGKLAMTGTADPLPQNTATLVRKRSGLAGRRRNGRMYLPPGFKSNVDANGNINGPELTALQNAANAWLAFVNGQTVVQGMVILHSTGLTAAPVPTPVKTLVVQPVVATQRRRLRP